MSARNNYLLNRFFSRSMIKNLLRNKKDDGFARIIQNEEKLIIAVKEAYQQLSKGYRNEYFYKNTLFNKKLLGVHSLNTTTALTEIPVGSAKPDFILINGKAIVYEIKTELDNLERLENQINEYYKAFDHVAIVTYEKNLDPVRRKIADLNKPVGLYALQKNESFKTLNKPEPYRDDLDKSIMFKILRKKEYESIILKRFGLLPQVSQFDYYDVCKEKLLTLPIDEFYLDFLAELKTRNAVDKEKFKKIPYELKFLVYFMDFKTKDYDILDNILTK
ncbi:sce7726 family protein [Streptococcus loxodontisalivarius]|uniref:Sce7726 family protein n=1 Tax=Streptococcus loxodontisalivarius TaxID=1349415 RepID=A0ABS2PTH5_9STRE|nr:sce7726 family protein [Streptococcus loxodontisalivarius]MBM7643337.1 hypothetical protein [Streptococcus loxodontisalivarius]